MLGHQLVVVSDAHIGASPPEDDEALVAFLDRVPTLGDCLLVNGDLFDFWFAYRRVVPRAGFAAAAALATLARKLPVVMTGGNHDRWGDSFWSRDAGIRFAPGELVIEVAGSRVLALHGDGVAEEHRSARVMHRVTRHPLTVGVFRWLHPDLGFWLVRRMSRHLADSTRDPAVLDRAQVRQRRWAEERMARDPSIRTLIMSHTHRPAREEIAPGRWYLNPGAWIEGRRYAVVTASGVDLRRCEGPAA
jgi:UDP-2,3-diacylglucosamine hydrolase